MTGKILFSTLVILSTILGGPRSSSSLDGSIEGLNFAKKRVPEVEKAMILAGHGENIHALEQVLRADSNRALGAEGRRFRVKLMTELGMYGRADSLLFLMTPGITKEGNFLHYLWRAKLNLQAGRNKEAFALLGAIDSVANAEFGSYRDLLVLQTNYQLGRVDEALKIGEEILTTGVLTPSMTAEFENSMVDIYVAAQRGDQACDLLMKMVRRARNPQDRLKLLTREYDIRVRLGELAAARKTASRIAASYGRFKESETVVTDVLSRLKPDEMSSEELITFVQLAIDRSNFQTAGSLLKILDRRTLSPAGKEKLRITKARYYYLNGQFRQARDLAKLRYRIPTFKRHSILILARSYRKLGDKGRAAKLYEYFAQSFPNDTKSAEALFVASQLYESIGWPQAAQRVSDRMQRSYPSSYFGRVAELRSARRLMARGKYDSSRKLLQGVLKRSRYTDEGALYYLGKTYSKTGDERRNQMLLSDITNINPHSFYLKPRVEIVFQRPHTSSTGGIALGGDNGLLALLESAAVQRTDAYFELKKVLNDSRKTKDGMPLKAEPYVKRGVWFFEAGLRDWGERELEYAMSFCSKSPVGMLELGRIYDRYNLPWRSVRLYQRVKDSIHWEKRRELSDEFQWLMYPIPYPAQVLENSAHYDLPPHLVYAMIREESYFDFNAVSRVGALGLMQLMPETGKYVARELEVPEWGDDSLLKPEINLAFGIWYASSLMDACGNDPLRMLAAYNAGPGNARRWFGNNKDGDSVIDVVDGIDFKETRSYVQRVVESANIYFSLYFSPDAAVSGCCP